MQLLIMLWMKIYLCTFMILKSISKFKKNSCPQPPQRHHWNGPLRGYYVGHKVYGSGQFSYQTVESSDRRGGTLLIQGLQKATTYTVVVKAFNAAGSGPPSHEMHVATLEEGMFSWCIIIAWF